MPRIGWWVMTALAMIIAGWIILRQRAPAIIPDLRTVASCLLISLLTGGLSACGERPAQRSETSADTTTPPEPAAAKPPPATSTAERLSAYIVHGVCPFKCCRYGNWTSRGGGVLRSAPSLGADSVGGIAPGAQMRTDSGVMVLHPPGIGVIVSDFAGASSGPQAGDTVEVLNYVGHGQQINRVRWQGQELEMTSGVQIVREPMQQWWVYATDPTTMVGGWMLMGGVSAGEVGALPDSCYRR